MYATKTLTRQFDVSADTLRYYEKLGLLQKASRLDNGYRVYQPDTPKRLHFIQHCQTAGFTLKEIKQLLDFDENPSSTWQEITAFIEQKHAALHEHIKDLTKIETLLTIVLKHCNSNVSNPREKSILGTFEDLNTVDSP